MGYVQHPPFCAPGRVMGMRYRLILQKNILSVIFQHYSRFFINFLYIFSLKLILTFFKNLYMRFSQKSENVTWPTVTLSSSYITSMI